ncbi:alpha/beta hydrolase [Vibrio ruber]|uniref:alpha/beta fold hydrolase n=1 Tax=Vibrio ruber TaxID=184755 RepID=UPI0028934798|nr:alpha/beta hydrolase [Vibrio ruber]WNJ97757.1 alpha/beta hydrolase [Vibrio ruber]
MSSQYGYIEINGASLYYELSGNPNGEPLVMLHGGLGSQHDLLPIHPYLAPDYHLISIDFRGHGKSLLGDLPLSYLQYQQDIQYVLNSLGIERYSIFGFSDGGIVGYRIAAQAPEKVSCLMTLGAHWRLAPDDPSISIFNGLTADFWAERFADDVAAYHASNPEPDFPKLVDAVKNVWLDTTTSGYPFELVKQIRCPTLIMRGDNDFLFSLDEAVSLKSQMAEAAFANIPMTAHAAHQESPELVGNMLHRFLSQHKSDPAHATSI